jgi:hypothetical protein
MIPVGPVSDAWEGLFRHYKIILIEDPNRGPGFPELGSQLLG